jgi:hypothetical protein
VRKLTGDHCQCAACGEYFNSTVAFDKHRVHKIASMEPEIWVRGCLDTPHMKARGMAVSSTGWWITSVKADSSLSRMRQNGDLEKPVQGEGVCGKSV